MADDEHGVVEDAIADCIGVMAVGSFVGDATVSKVVQIVALSERMPSDTSFARQLKRKF